MKILITGAAGQLGSELCRQLQQGKSALGPLHSSVEAAQVVAVDIDDADLTNLEQTLKLVSSNAPDVVINCAAFTNVDLAETEQQKAFEANAIAPRNLAMACEAAGAKLIHVSTDYVFSGSLQRPYTEADLPAPTTAYGATKLLGEEYVRQFCTRWFVVRTAWLYGRQGANFVKTMLRLADEQSELKVVHDQRGNPTFAEDLAHHLLQLAATQHYGVYHCTGGGVCSWYEFAAEIFRIAGKDVKLLPCTTEEYPRPAPRPQNSALEHTMLKATIGDGMRPWQEALFAYLKQSEDN